MTSTSPNRRFRKHRTETATDAALTIASPLAINAQVSPLDSIDALKEYPLKVTYPKAGDLYLLRWWTEWDRGHVIAAASEERVEGLLRHIMIKEGHGVQPKEYWRATLVSPPLELRENYSRGRLLEDMDDFRWFVGSLFDQAADKDHPVKKTAKRCKKYSPRYESDESDDKTHTSCLNCFKGWLPANDTVESLYLRRRLEPRHRTWDVYKPDPNKRTGIPLTVESTAPVADLSRPLYALEHAFGDHSEGLRIIEVKKNEDGVWPWGVHFHKPGIIFFFQGEKLDVPKKFITLAKTAITDHKKAIADEAKARATKQKQSQMDANERLRRMLEP